jgi:hypothetical protein
MQNKGLKPFIKILLERMRILAPQSSRREEGENNNELLVNYLKKKTLNAFLETPVFVCVCACMCLLYVCFSCLSTHT